MAYIGTSPSNGVRRVHTYTATANQTTFTGSSTEGVTLTYADTNYIDVFQNGVLLGSADYTSTSGTSVVLAQGASVSDLVVIVVYDVFSVADTVSKTSGGSFDSAVTFDGDITIGDASAADKKILFDGNAVDYHIGLDDSADSLIIGKGSALGTTTAMSIDANGQITKPLQSAFSAHKNGTNQNNLSTSVATTVTFSTERFDVNSDFNTSTSTFTAPVTGKYFLTVTLRLQNTDTASDFIISKIITSNESYSFIYDPNAFDIDAVYFGQTVTILADMDANDTAHIEVRIVAGTAQTDVEGNAEYTYFTGYLAC